MGNPIICPDCNRPLRLGAGLSGSRDVDVWLRAEFVSHMNRSAAHPQLI
jgi:hypothetical protein